MSPENSKEIVANDIKIIISSQSKLSYFMFYREQEKKKLKTKQFKADI